jgi:hypothetical protein
MRRIKINSLWKPSFIAARDKEGRYGIYSEVVLEKILQYERSRADREGGYFSVVLFKLEGNDASNERLITILKNSTRLIDHVGWYEKDIVCVVLTATELKGAQLFAQKIEGVVETEYRNGKRPIYSHELFRYPDTHKNDGEHDVFTIYKGNKLRINEELMSSFTMDIPGWEALPRHFRLPGGTHCALTAFSLPGRLYQAGLEGPGPLQADPGGIQRTQFHISQVSHHASGQR